MSPDRWAHHPTLRHQIGVHLCGDHAHIDLSGLPRAARPVVAAALAHHLQIDVVALAKAQAGGEGPDPRFPELELLIEKVRTQWSRWTRWLVDRLTQRVETQTATPEVVATLLDTHEIGVTKAITGAELGTPHTSPMVPDPELMPAQPETQAPIAVAFRLGRDVDPETPPRVPDAPHEPPPASSLSLADQAALAYARSRAAIHLRRPIADVRATAERILLDDGIPIDRRALTAQELATVRQELADAIETGRSPKATAARLRAALADAKLSNDMDRIARTEIAAAHHHGAYAALRASLPADADPEVYKITNPKACSQCLRIWGHPANPVIYRLSVIEAFTASGGNYGRAAKEWGPTIGPTHPNCTCCPVSRWNPAVHDAVQDAAAELRRIFR